MAESSIPVDLLNPGHVFACLGILESADVLLGEAKGAFDWTESSETVFRVSATGSTPPVERVMQFLEEANMQTHVPSGSPNIDAWKSGWGDLPEISVLEKPFPYPDPASPATLPVLLSDSEGHAIMVDYWGDVTQRDNVKFWAGSGGYPGAALLRDALKYIRGELLFHAKNPFALAIEQSSSFRFDWRRDYIPVQDGFSPNKHANIQMLGFPVVEILAAIGMTSARPCRKTKLEYKYAVLGYRNDLLLDPVFHRATLGAEKSPVPGWPFRRFDMRLDWPGQEGQARCIIQVTEETIDQ